MDFRNLWNTPGLSDLLVEVHGTRFELSRFPLCAKSEFMRGRCIDRPGYAVRLEHFPGGATAFGVAARFCYGFDISEDIQANPQLLGQLVKAADYLKMHGPDNLKAQVESWVADAECLQNLRISLTQEEAEEEASEERLSWSLVATVGVLQNSSPSRAADLASYFTWLMPQEMFSLLSLVECEEQQSPRLSSFLTSLVVHYLSSAAYTKELVEELAHPERGTSHAIMRSSLLDQGAKFMNSSARLNSGTIQTLLSVTRALRVWADGQVCGGEASSLCQEQSQKPHSSQSYPEPPDLVESAIIAKGWIDREGGPFLRVFVALMARHLGFLNIWDFLDTGITLGTAELIWNEALLGGVWKQDLTCRGTANRYSLVLDEWAVSEFAIAFMHCCVAKGTRVRPKIILNLHRKVAGVCSQSRGYQKAISALYNAAIRLTPDDAKALEGLVAVEKQATEQEVERILAVTHIRRPDTEPLSRTASAPLPDVNPQGHERTPTKASSRLPSQSSVSMAASQAGRDSVLAGDTSIRKETTVGRHRLAQTSGHGKACDASVASPSITEQDDALGAVTPPRWNERPRRAPSFNNTEVDHLSRQNSYDARAEHYPRIELKLTEVGDYKKTFGMKINPWSGEVLWVSQEVDVNLACWNLEVELEGPTRSQLNQTPGFLKAVMGPFQNLTATDQLSANVVLRISPEYDPWILKAAVRVQVGVMRDTKGGCDSWDLLGEQCSIVTLTSTDPKSVWCRRLCDGQKLKDNRFRDIRVYASVVMLALNGRAMNNDDRSWAGNWELCASCQPVS